MGMRISESMSNVSFHCRGFALKFSHSPPVPPPPLSSARDNFNAGTLQPRSCTLPSQWHFPLW